MPHVIVKLWPGKSEEQKQKLADDIVNSVTKLLGSGEASISIAFEEVAPDKWIDEVFRPDILDKWDTLAKEPGYGPRRDRGEKS